MKSISVMLSTAAFALASLAAYFAAGMAVAWIENSSAKAVNNGLPWKIILGPVFKLMVYK